MSIIETSEVQAEKNRRSAARERNRRARSRAWRELEEGIELNFRYLTEVWQNAMPEARLRFIVNITQLNSPEGDDA